MKFFKVSLGLRMDIFNFTTQYLIFSNNVLGKNTCISAENQGRVISYLTHNQYYFSLNTTLHWTLSHTYEQVWCNTSYGRQVRHTLSEDTIQEMHFCSFKKYTPYFFYFMISIKFPYNNHRGTICLFYKIHQAAKNNEPFKVGQSRQWPMYHTTV